MLEIQIDNALRYVASAPTSDGQFDDDSYPVRRGTAMKPDDYTALVWVHGATTALNPRFKYFQGKRPDSCAVGGTSPCRADRPQTACGGNIGLVEDELEHVRSLHEAARYRSFLKRDRADRIAASKSRRCFLRLSPVHLERLFNCPRLSRERAAQVSRGPGRKRGFLLRLRLPCLPRGHKGRLP